MSEAQALVASNLPIPSALGSLEAYIGAVHQIPVLAADEEQQLARRYREHEDLDAARDQLQQRAATAALQIIGVGGNDNRPLDILERFKTPHRESSINC